MTVRKAWTLFGVVVLGQEALAHAHVNEEQRFSVGDVEVSMGLGLLNGQSKEKVYDEGEKLSQLNWAIKQALMFIALMHTIRIILNILIRKLHMQNLNIIREAADSKV